MVAVHVSVCMCVWLGVRAHVMEQYGCKYL